MGISSRTTALGQKNGAPAAGNKSCMSPDLAESGEQLRASVGALLRGSDPPGGDSNREGAGDGYSASSGHFFQSPARRKKKLAEPVGRVGRRGAGGVTLAAVGRVGERGGQGGSGIHLGISVKGAVRRGAVAGLTSHVDLFELSADCMFRCLSLSRARGP